MTPASPLPEGRADGRAETQAEHFAACGCHDSWDQCPCADSGHPVDRSCGCCPLGTGICGPWPEAGPRVMVDAPKEVVERFISDQAHALGVPGFAAPVVAVPEAGERERCRCGHPRHQHDGWDDAVMECERCSCDVFEHPEPGDRAVRACARCGASYRWYPRTATTRETFSHLIGPDDGHMPVLHGEDAKFYLRAAVAADRGDLAAKVEAQIWSAPGTHPNSIAGQRDAAQKAAYLRAAAIVRGEP